MITFAWDNPDRLLAQTIEMLRARGRAVRRVPAQAVRRGTFELLKLVQKHSPKKTGTLVRTIHAAVEQISTDLIEGRVGTWLEYARYLEEGTGVYGPKGKPIQIVATRKKALFWGAFNENGKAICAKRVTIQGIKPRGYFAKAIQEFLPRYIQIIEEELAKEAA